MFYCVVCQDITYWEYIQFKTNKLEARAMARVTEPSRKPYSRYSGKPNKSISPLSPHPHPLE